MSNKNELAHNFTNFMGAIYNLKNTYEQMAKARKGMSRAIIERDMKNDLANVPLALSRIGGQFGNFLNEHITDKELQREAARELIAVVDETRDIIEGGDYDEVEKRLSYLDSIEAIVYKYFSEVLEPKSGAKLRLNAPKNVVCDLIRQLKNLKINGNDYFLTQTYEELAAFLIEHVEGFEDDTAINLGKNMMKKDNVKKRRFEVKTIG